MGLIVIAVTSYSKVGGNSRNSLHKEELILLEVIIEIGAD